MEVTLIFILFSYLVISTTIYRLIYEQSHFFVIEQKKDHIGQQPKQFYKETLNIIDTFGTGTPSEIRSSILDSISVVAFLIKNICYDIVWKDPGAYQSCDFSIACDLHNILDKKTRLNKTASEIYLIEIQNIFDDHFDYWDGFVVANKFDQEDSKGTVSYSVPIGNNQKLVVVELKQCIFDPRLLVKSNAKFQY